MPAASHSLNQPEPNLFTCPSGPAKGYTKPNDGVVVEASGSTGDHDKDSTVGISEDAVDQGGSRSDSGNDSWECVTDSGPKSASGDCPTCLDNKEAAVRSAHKKFHKKVLASCSLAKLGLWRNAQLEWISNNHQTLWGSDYKGVKTEWDPTLKEDYSSFKVSRMTIQTDQLLWIKEATNAKIYLCEHGTEVHGRKKILVHSLKQFYAV